MKRTFARGGRLVCFALIVCLLVSNVAWAAWDGFMEEKSEDGTYVLVDMNNFGNIVSAGALPVSDVRYSARYSARWGNMQSSKTLNFNKNIPRDWSEYETLEFWAYSPGPKDSKFILLVDCESDQGLSYFNTTISVDWTGWKLFSYPLVELTGARGASYTKVVDLRFTINGWGMYAEEGTAVYFDNIVLKKAAENAVGTAEARYSEELRAQFETLAAESSLVYAGSAGTIQNGEKTVLAGGRTALDRAGAVMVPTGYLADALGVQVQQQAGGASVTANGHTLQLTAGSADAALDGVAQTLSAAPVEEGGTLYVPLAECAQALGFFAAQNGKLAAVSASQDLSPIVQDSTLAELASYQTTYVNVDVDALTTEDYAAVRAKWRKLFVGDETNDLSDEQVAKSVQAVSDKGKSLQETMQKGDGIPDLWANTHITTTNQMTLEFENIKDMAMAYATYGSELYQNQTLKEDILYAMDWMNANLYGPKEMENKGWRDPTEYNWWDWRIGSARATVDILMIMEPDLTPEQIKKYIAPVDYFGQQVTSVGSNRLNGAYVQIGAALLQDDGARLVRARDGIDDTFWYHDDGEGMHMDGSYIYHNKHPMNAAYGAEHLQVLAPLLAVLDDSAFSIAQLLRDYVTQWIYNAYEPFFYKGAMMGMVNGRGVETSEHVSASNLIQAMLRILDMFEPEDQAKIKSFIKQQVQEDASTDYTALLSVGEMAKLGGILSDETVVPRQNYTLNKVYHDMDRVVHHQEGFSVGIAMSSSRIYNYESINNQNATGWYIGDGMLYLYNDDDTMYDPTWWRVSNPYRRPGTTVDTQERQALQITNDDAYLSSKDFVGGVSLKDTYGVASMWLDSFSKEEETPNVTASSYGVPNPLHSCSLEAQKSWFLFDDEVVALGAGIVSQDGVTVETIVDNRKASATETISHDSVTPYTAVAVTASDEPQPENAAANAADASLSTRWSAENNAWLQLDLGEVKQLGTAAVAIYRGNERINYFDLQVSEDGTNWTTVFEGGSSGTTTELEQYDLGGISGRYVRFFGHGLNNGTWNSVTEFRVYPPSPDGSPITFGENEYINQDTVLMNGQEMNLNSAVTQVPDVRWAHYEDQLGYYFPDAPTLSMRKTNTGPSFFELWFDHGVNPNQATYAYALLPGKTPEETQAYAQNPDIEVLSNTNAVQAVRENTLGTTGIVFWRSGSLGEVRTNQALTVMVQEQDGTYTIAVSDPSQKLQSAAVTLSRTDLTPVQTDGGVSVQQGADSVTLTYDLQGSRGKTFTASFQVG